MRIFTKIMKKLGLINPKLADEPDYFKVRKKHYTYPERAWREDIWENRAIVDSDSWEEDF
jgi:hypothetical protein